MSAQCWCFFFSFCLVFVLFLTSFSSCSCCVVLFVQSLFAFYMSLKFVWFFQQTVCLGIVVCALVVLLFFVLFALLGCFLFFFHVLLMCFDLKSLLTMSFELGSNKKYVKRCHKLFV